MTRPADQPKTPSVGKPKKSKRTIRNPKLDSPSARINLPVDAEPWWSKLAPNEHLGYFKASKGEGFWRCRLYFPATKKFLKKALGASDDFDAEGVPRKADGIKPLTYLQARAKAEAQFKVWKDEANLKAQGEPVPTGTDTVAQAMNDYFADAGRTGASVCPCSDNR